MLLTIYALLLTAASQNEVLNLAPGNAVPIDQQLGSDGALISVRAPAFEEWSLSPHQDLNELIGTMEIITPGQGNPWTVTIMAGTDNDGILAEYDTTAGRYVDGGKKLSSSIQIEAEGGNTIDLANGGYLIRGKGPASIPFKLKQAVSFEDSPLADGHVYLTSIKFAITSG